MAHVDVTVNGRKYKMGCREGQERRVTQLAEKIDAIVQEIKSSKKLIPDDRLFLMAAIVMADRALEAQDELQRSQKANADVRAYQIIEGGQREATRHSEPGAIKQEGRPLNLAATA